jgi:hypothetical protein
MLSRREHVPSRAELVAQRRRLPRRHVSPRRRRAKSPLRTTIWCRPSASVSSVSGGAAPAGRRRPRRCPRADRHPHGAGRRRRGGGVGRRRVSTARSSRWRLSRARAPCRLARAHGESRFGGNGGPAVACGAPVTAARTCRGGFRPALQAGRWPCAARAPARSAVRTRRCRRSGSGFGVSSPEADGEDGLLVCRHQGPRRGRGPPPRQCHGRRDQSLGRSGARSRHRRRRRPSAGDGSVGAMGPMAAALAPPCAEPEGAPWSAGPGAR